VGGEVCQDEIFCSSELFLVLPTKIGSQMTITPAFLSGVAFGYLGREKMKS
jgi:hypothetical protein